MVQQPEEDQRESARRSLHAGGAVRRASSGQGSPLEWPPRLAAEHAPQPRPDGRSRHAQGCLSLALRRAGYAPGSANQRLRAQLPPLALRLLRFPPDGSTQGESLRLVVPSAYWLGGASAASDDLRRNWGIRSSVMWRYAKLIKSGKMERCGISGIGVPSIAWISLGEPHHQLITKHLCNNGRAGNRIDAGVPLDNGFVWADERTQFVRR